MSSARGGERGGFGRGRGRGGATQHVRNAGGYASDGEGGSSRGSYRGRGRGNTRASTATSASTRGAPAGPRQRQLGGPQSRPPSRSNNNHSASKPNGAQAAARAGVASTAGLPYPQRYETLKSNRQIERKNAIANGLIADPDKPRRLEDAITIVGTCPDMCAEYERVERVVQKDVWELEQEPGTKEPAEHRMVKKFRRAAAGLEEQLPSDLRPPHVLKTTCDYLFGEILSEYDLGKAHKFLWDRTRAIRNDFSIQQCTKVPDVRVQIECFERIARFHILSLHQLALSKDDLPPSYDRHQDREQLDKTLLSLVTLYDQNREKYRSKYEPEFRAYCVLFQISALVPDIENRIQSDWPMDMVKHPRVQRALKIYAAAADLLEPLGPLNPRIPHPIAQSNPAKFFKLVASNEVSYLMGCVAEMEFNSIRKAALNNIWKGYRIGGDRKVEDWTLPELTRVLYFDDDEETREFCEAYGFSILEKDDGSEFLDLTSVPGRQQLPDSSPTLRKQFRSETIIEPKRHYRSYPAIINGLSVREAKEHGMIEEQPVNETQQSLFVNQDSDTETEKATPTSSFTSVANPFAAAAPLAPQNPFAAASVTQSPFGKPDSPATMGGFGAPSNHASATTTPASPATNPFSSFSATSASTTAAPAANTKSPFQLGGAPSAVPSPFAESPAASSLSDTDAKPSSPFQLGAQTTPFSAFGQPPQSQKSTTPKSSFEQPSDTPPGSPPKSNPFGGVTSSAPITSKPAFPAETTSAGNDEQSLSGTNSIFGFPPVKGTANADEESTPSSGGTFGFNTAKPATETSQQPSPSSPSSTSIFGFPPASTKASAPTTLATAAPASSPFPGFKPMTNDTSNNTALSDNSNPFGFNQAQLSGSSPASFSLDSSQPSAPSTTTSDQIGKTISPFLPTTTLGTGTPDSRPTLGSFNPSKFSTPSAPVQAPTIPIAPKVPSAPISLGNHSATPASLPLVAHPSATVQSKPQVSSEALAIAEEKARQERLSNTALDKVTESLVLEPTGGLLTQFVEHVASGILKEALQMFQYELDCKRADEFRAHSLASHYGRLWNNIRKANKARRRGRERRKARRTALNASVAQSGPARIEADVQDFKRTMGSSMRRMASSRGAHSEDDFRGSFSSSVGLHDLLERDRVRRPTSSQKDSYAMSGALNSSRRSSTQDTLGPSKDQFRVAKFKKAPIQPPQRYRATFLSGQPLIPKDSSYTGRISTTQTDYFRLKALGINYEDVYGDRHSRKRYREFDDDGEDLESSAGSASVSPPGRKKRITAGPRDSYRLSQSRTPSGEQRNVGTPTSAPSTYQAQRDVDAADDALISRFHAIRKSLNESADFFRSTREQIQQEDAQSTRSSTADPLARSYSSFRASYFPQSETASASLPKYWSRESKFLPRSEYGGGRWLAQKQQEKGKGKAADTSAKLIKSHSESHLQTQSTSTLKGDSQKAAFGHQIASQLPNSQASTAHSFLSFAPGGNNQLEGSNPLQSFSSVVPDSNPFVTQQATPNGVGTPGDEIMILSSDDDVDTPAHEATPAKESESSSDDDSDVVMEVKNNHDESQSGSEQFEPQYAQHEEFGSQFEEQYQSGQAFELDDEEEEVDPVLLDEEDDEESQEEEEEDESSEEQDQDGSSDEDEEVQDEDEFVQEDETEDDEDEDDNTGAKYRDKGNSFDDAIEL